jgi:uncharacterized membrane protein YfhO
MIGCLSFGRPAHTSGIFVSSIFQDRLGYKRTIQIFLVALTGFIFIVFYAPTVEVLFAGLVSPSLVRWYAVLSVASLWSPLGRIFECE